MSNYQDIIIEIFRNTGGGSSKSIRARPVAGLNLDTSMKVECFFFYVEKSPGWKTFSVTS